MAFTVLNIFSTVLPFILATSIISSGEQIGAKQLSKKMKIIFIFDALF